MSRELMIRNRQRARTLDVPLLRRLTRHVLETEMGLASYELGLHLVEPAQMARVNEHYLGHEGSTDVITFDHNEGDAHPHLHGELFISIADAVAQAHNFGTTWPSEVVRYIIHGLLHLRGFDDLDARARRIMKREENRLVKKVSAEFKVSQLSRPRR